MLMSGAMNAYMRRVNQRAMNFGDEREDIVTPAPVPGRKYLLYVHIPFCEILCPFCSFHRVEYTADKAVPYFAALRQEIRYYREQGYDFGEVYIGGGTPTVNSEELAETIELIRSLYSIGQISAETNPDHLDAGQLGRLKDSGINRLSVGVQSFDDELLKGMQRYDKYGSCEQLIERLQGANGIFDTLNVDMIFNLPEQTRDSLARDLDIIRNRIEVDQASFYPLMAGASTRKRMSRDMGVVTRDNEREYYDLIRREMGDPFRPNSAWCLSRSDGMIDEYICNHEEYVGVGSGAFSVLNGSMYATTFSIARYRDLVPRIGHAMAGGRAFSKLEQYRYHFMMTLFGLSMSRSAVRERFGDDYFRVLWREFLVLRLLGAFRDDGDRINVTERGMYYWVVMMREFLTGVDRLRDRMRLHVGEEARRAREREVVVR